MKNTAIHVDGRHSDIFRKSPGLEMGPLKESLADSMMPAQAIMARVTGDMVCCGHPVSRLELFNPIPYGDDFPCHLMSQDERHLIAPVPLHHITAAYTACSNPHKKLPRPYLGSRHLFQADILVTVIH
jgi:hypothetical protein